MGRVQPGLPCRWAHRNGKTVLSDGTAAIAPPTAGHRLFATSCPLRELLEKVGTDLWDRLTE